jgi:DNA polymerase-3 subunit alpha
MSDDFVHLHVHSEYSFLDGLGHPADFVARAKELRQKAIAITDHGNVSAHKRWFDACKEGGIKPILGVEAYVCDDALKKTDRRMYHITLLAKNLVGYRNILKLVSASWQDGFYYKPRTDWEMLRQYSEGVVATSGCPGGRLGHGVSKEGWTGKRVTDELKRQAAIFDDYYVEMSPWQYPEGQNFAKEAYEAVKREGFKPILTMDAHYPRPEDAKTQDIMLCIQNNCKFSDPDRMKFSQDDYCLHSGNDMAAKWHAIHGKSLPLLDDMIVNTRRIADMTNFDFRKATPLAFQHKGDKAKLLRKLCEAGLKSRKLHDRPAYRERLEYEYELVCSKNFVDYFLVVADLIVWAKEQGILVGPARGSSCGSLMCFLLRITEIDPLLHSLMMERFIDVSRSDLPDIDIDFDAERRHEVKEYLEATYGADRVANLATFSTFKGKMCLQDIGRVFSDKIPFEAVDECKRLIVERSSADSRAGFTIEDTFTNFEQAAGHLKKYPELAIAKTLEGQIRQLGVHAAGVVISNEPIGNFAAVYITKNKDRVISMDYHDAVSVGLLKIDVLGLTALTAIKRTIEAVKRNHGKKIEINDTPLDDAAVFENFCQQKLQGIFQFEGESTRQVCRQIQPKKFDDLVAINALSRPGPLHSGGTTSFIERRFGREPVVLVHPIFDGVTKDTYGIAVYQEQVMRVVKDMGLFSWKETATIRQAMSKKYGDEFFATMGAKFVAGATSQGASVETAKKVWENICTFGSWAFNRSHSVAYSVMAYQLMWLKTHYAPEFYASVVSCDDDTDKQRRVLKEYTMSGRPLLPVCINNSCKQITADKTGLRLGFDAVKGLPEKAADAIVAARPYKNLIDFKARCKVPKTLPDKLLRLGAFRDLLFAHTSAQGDLFGADQSVTDDADYRNPKQADVMELCPLAVQSDVNEKWRAWIKTKAKTKIWTIRELDEITTKTDVVIIGFTNAKNSFNLKNKQEEAQSRGKAWNPKEQEKHYTKEQYNFLNFGLEDETDDIIVRVSYNMYPKFKDMLWALKPDEPVLVQGMLTGVMRMCFSYNIISLPKFQAKLEAKGKLTPQEQDLLSGIKKKQFNGTRTFSQFRK